LEFRRHTSSLRQSGLPRELCQALSAILKWLHVQAESELVARPRVIPLQIPFSPDNPLGIFLLLSIVIIVFGLVGVALVTRKSTSAGDESPLTPEETRTLEVLQGDLASRVA